MVALHVASRRDTPAPPTAPRWPALRVARRAPGAPHPRRLASGSWQFIFGDAQELRQQFPRIDVEVYGLAGLAVGVVPDYGLQRPRPARREALTHAGQIF